MLREMWVSQERRKTGRRRQETEEDGKDYQMRRRRNCGQHLTPDKRKKTIAQCFVVMNLEKAVSAELYMFMYTIN